MSSTFQCDGLQWWDCAVAGVIAVCVPLLPDVCLFSSGDYFCLSHGHLFAVDVGMEVVGSCGGVLPALRCRSQGTPPWVRGQLMEGRRSLQVLVRYSSRRRQH